MCLIIHKQSVLSAWLESDRNLKIVVFCQDFLFKPIWTKFKDSYFIVPCESVMRCWGDDACEHLCACPLMVPCLRSRQKENMASHASTWAGEKTDWHPLPSTPPTAFSLRPYLRFWYQVLTCVSVRLREAASSIRSWTLRYFWRSKLRSSCASWWSVKAVRAFLGFLSRTCGLSLLLEISLSPSSFTAEQKESREWDGSPR